jgi:serine/threonine protein kinase/TolA-binding protein
VTDGAAGELDRVIDELAARPAGEWAALVRARFPDDPALARQVLAWLTAQRDDARGDPTTALESSARYELGQKLDAGATATVWRAYDRKLRRDVAIKVFAPGSSPALDEILGEARAACEVISEHVVRVLDVHDVHDREPPYLVMELVGEHEPRTGALQIGASAASSRPRDIWEAVRWVRDVARGVHDAHLRNVFHRDLKPHNVLITPISRRAKIADFGLAVSNAGQAAAPTRSGMVVEVGADRVATRIAGTPAYMAPEQARGLSIALDPRNAADRATLTGVDVWGLGAIAYDLLSGQPPWRAARDSHGGLEVWEVAAGDAAPPAIDRTARGERIPRRLRLIVARALAPAPEARYASAGELADELHAVLLRRPTGFDRSPLRRAALWARRNPQLTVTAVVAIGLAGMSLAAYATLLHLNDQRTALAAEMQADKERFAAQVATARRELDDTEASLRTQTESLHDLQHELKEAENDYHTIVLAKEQALRSATVARSERDAARDDLDIADRARDLYESFWLRARKEVDDVTRDRDTARSEREAARLASEQAHKDAEEARTTRIRVEHERDDARGERDRNVSARRQAEADVARLMEELAAALGRGGGGGDGSGSSSPPAAKPATPPGAGSATPKPAAPPPPAVVTPAPPPAAGSAAVKPPTSATAAAPAP